MVGDPADKNDDELLSQIDELKARMDRLMRGGSSTSNSALLTEAARAKTAETEATEPPTATPPSRSRVGDLIETEDTEVVEVYPRPKEVVPFPADANPTPPQPKRSVAPPASAPPSPDRKPVSRPRPASTEGSLISIDDAPPGARPQATSFDELGNVIQQELARDISVPPAEAKKGPDLASRFGSAEDRAVVEPAPVPEREVKQQPVEEELELVEEYEEDVEAEYEHEDEAPEGRSPKGLVAAIWVFTAVASGAIATLHFTGIV